MAVLAHATADAPQAERPWGGHTLVDVLRDAARRTPLAIAVQDDHGALTYQQLDARAAQLGAYLRTRGAGPGTFTAVLVDRSVDMVVAVLGVLHAGSAYLPITPMYPRERIEFMLADSGAGIVVTQEAQRDALAGFQGEVVSLDGDHDVIEAPVPLGPDAQEPDALAYVIYTSGSTGRPKGVMVEQRSVLNLLAAMRSLIAIGEGDAMVALAPLAFDMSVPDVFLPLVSGARIVIAPRETALAPRVLVALMRRAHATHMQATPSTWRMLIDAGWTGSAEFTAICGGEALPQRLADALVSQGVALWNFYGPTEATVWATCHRIRAVGEPVSIGEALPNMFVHVLDAERRPVAPGTLGELCIGGAAVARGYLNRPALTAERFVTWDVDGTGPTRLYRTGDLARIRSDGLLECLGRVDDQIKLRGFRIELGEVEAALARLPGVRAAAAAVREREDGEMHLVGYLTTDTDDAPSPDELRRALLPTLPPYMVPDTIMLLDALPLSANGKVDRKQLPAPSVRALDAGREIVAPRTPLEAQLLTIWEEVLNRQPISVTDDFFELGATSIVAARVFDRIERDLGTRLPLSPLFQAPTIERLAALIDGRSTDRRWTSLVAVQPNGTKRPFFCVHGGAGTILHFQPLARRLGEDQPFYGLQMQGLYGDAPPHLTIEQMARHYVTEIRSVQPEGPYLLGGYCYGAIIAVEMARHLTEAGEKVGLLVNINGPAPAYNWTNAATRSKPRASADASVLAGDGMTARAVLALKRVRWALEAPKLRARWERLRLDGSHRGLDVLTRMLVLLRQPIPAAWREEAVVNVCRFAERRFHPRPYDGDMLLLRPPAVYRTRDLRWSGLIRGELSIYDIPGEHAGLRDAMLEPNVAFVAERIATAIAQLS